VAMSHAARPVTAVTTTSADVNVRMPDLPVRPLTLGRRGSVAYRVSTGFT